MNFLSILNVSYWGSLQIDPGWKQWIDGKLLITIFSRMKASRHKFANGLLEIFSQKFRTYCCKCGIFEKIFPVYPCSHMSLEWNLDTCRRNIKTFYCFRNSDKYVNKIQKNNNSK